MAPTPSPLSHRPSLITQAPITTGTLGFAIAITIYFWYGHDPGFIPMTPLGFSSEPWRLVTSTLAHGGFLHLIFNLYWLKLFGPLLEERLHPLLVVGLFLTIAAGSGAAQFAVGVGGVGLSGVLYGCFGFLWYASSRVDAFRGLLPQSTIKLMVGWFFLCIIATRIGVLNVANVAHGVGGLMGWLAAWVVLSERRTRPYKTLGYYGLLGLFLLGGSVWRGGLLAAFAGEGYIAYSSGLAEHDGSTAFLEAHGELERDLRGDTENWEDEDWEFIAGRATSLLERFEKESHPAPAVARILYMRAFARMRQREYESALEDAERALTINPNEPGVQPIVDSLQLWMKTVEP